jgi:hypothetical protein
MIKPRTQSSRKMSIEQYALHLEFSEMASVPFTEIDYSYKDFLEEDYEDEYIDRINRDFYLESIDD